jgi:hypothetical protein
VLLPVEVPKLKVVCFIDLDDAGAFAGSFLLEISVQNTRDVRRTRRRGYKVITLIRNLNYTVVVLSAVAIFIIISTHNSLAISASHLRNTFFEREAAVRAGVFRAGGGFEDTLDWRDLETAVALADFAGAVRRFLDVVGSSPIISSSDIL